MPAPKLTALDLNLLVVLDALLVEHSVSRAAKRLNSTQPAVSRALGRLRVWFGDPLLTRTRHGMVPTAQGIALAGEVRAALERIEGFVQRRDAFDPASSPRIFRLTMSEFPQSVLCVPLLARLREAAPFTGVRVLPWSLGFPEALESGGIDCAVCPRPSHRLPGIHVEELFTAESVVVLRRGHPAAAAPLTVRRFAALTHLQTAPNGREGSLLDDLLLAAGLSRRIVMTVPSAFVVPALVSSSDCCAVIPRPLALALADRWGLEVLPLPLDLPALSLNLAWHDRSHADPGCAWLRGQLKEIAAAHAGPKPWQTAALDLSRRAARTL